MSVVVPVPSVPHRITGRLYCGKPRASASLPVEKALPCCALWEPEHRAGFSWHLLGCEQETPGNFWGSAWQSPGTASPSPAEAHRDPYPGTGKTGWEMPPVWDGAAPAWARHGTAGAWRGRVRVPVPLCHSVSVHTRVQQPCLGGLVCLGIAAPRRCLPVCPCSPGFPWPHTPEQLQVQGRSPHTAACPPSAPGSTRCLLCPPGAAAAAPGAAVIYRRRPR